jgi:hypothetical protein
MLARAAPGLRFNEHLDEEDGPLAFEHACKLGLEGIVKHAAQYAMPALIWRRVARGIFVECVQQERTRREDRVLYSGRGTKRQSHRSQV